MQLKFYFTIFSFLFLFSETYSQSKKIIDIKVFSIENVSIRAIEVVNDSALWFAGSNGKFGRILNNKIQIDSVGKINNKNLNFRSIAFNGKNIFILSIENPAVLFKLDPFNNKIYPKIVYREEHEKVFYDSMKFFDKLNGIAMGDPTDNCLSVIITSDGGKTWKKLSCNDLPKIEEGEAAFAASNTNITIHGNNVWLVTGGKKARIFQSKDKGKTWKAYQTPIVQGENMTGIFSVDFYNEKNGIIMGGNWEEKLNFKETKALTEDGGRTWNLISNNKAPGYISCVQYIPNTKGNEIMAVSTEGIYHSFDKGNSWKKISDEKYYTIKFINNKTAWLSGINKIAKIKLQ